MGNGGESVCSFSNHCHRVNQVLNESVVSKQSTTFFVVPAIALNLLRYDANLYESDFIEKIIKL